MEAKLKEMEMILERIRAELESIQRRTQPDVEGLKDGENPQEQDAASPTGFPPVGIKELVQRVDKLEGTCGVEKVMITDIGERVQVIVQTPLGSVLVPLQHTSNTSKATAKTTYVDGTQSVSTGSGYGAPAFTGAMKGAPTAGMTPEQLQDFKKQTLQITQLQSKIKELEGKLGDANSMIRKGDDITQDLFKKEIEDVKEIYLYLDNINTTMSEKIASQRIEMEKISGDTPQPVNYDPFNYGEAYAGDIVDFEARKRIVELKLLLHSIQTAMNSMKESVRISPEIDLGFKVVRLDQLLESTGFGQSVKNGDLTSENGLLLNQSSDIEPPEKRYPKLEAFQTNSENKESTWAMTDSIMQTMYRLEVELGLLQKSVEGIEEATAAVKEKEPTEPAKSKADRYTKLEIDMDAETPPQPGHGSKRSGSANTTFADEHVSQDSYQFLHQANVYIEKTMANLSEALKRTEQRVETMYIENIKRKRDEAEKPKVQPVDQQKPLHPKVADVVAAPDRHPVKLRHLLQRFFRYQVPTDQYDVYRLPTLSGKGYLQNWPNKELKPALHKRYKETLASLLEPVCDEYMIKGQDGHYYRGDKAPPRVLHQILYSQL